MKFYPNWMISYVDMRLVETSLEVPILAGEKNYPLK
jgi:hypothetical protein